VVAAARYDAYPFQACTDPAKTLATVSRMVASVVLVVGSALLAGRTVGRAFGLDVPVGDAS
jgi:hypothetical protein